MGKSKEQILQEIKNQYNSNLFKNIFKKNLGEDYEMEFVPYNDLFALNSPQKFNMPLVYFPNKEDWRFKIDVYVDTKTGNHKFKLYTNIPSLNEKLKKTPLDAINNYGKGDNNIGIAISSYKNFKDNYDASPEKHLDTYREKGHESLNNQRKNTEAFLNTAADIDKLYHKIELESLRTGRSRQDILEEYIKNPAKLPADLFNTDYTDPTNELQLSKIVANVRDRINNTTNTDALQYEIKSKQDDRREIVNNVINSMNFDPALSQYDAGSLKEYGLDLLDDADQAADFVKDQLGAFKFNPQQYNFDTFLREVYMPSIKPMLEGADTRVPDNNISNLNAVGHGIGSSSIEHQNREKQQLMTRYDLDNATKVYDNSLRGLDAQGALLKQLSEYQNAANSPRISNYNTVANAIGNIASVQGQDRTTINNDLGLAGNAQTANINNEMAEDMALSNQKTIDNNQIKNDNAAAQNLLFSLANELAQLNLNEGFWDVNTDRITDEMFLNRINIESALRQAGLKQEAFELSKKQNKIEWAKALATFIAKAGYSGYKLYSGDPAGAIMPWVAPRQSFTSPKMN